MSATLGNVKSVDLKEYVCLTNELNSQEINKVRLIEQYIFEVKKVNGICWIWQRIGRRGEPRVVWVWRVEQTHYSPYNVLTTPLNLLSTPWLWLSSEMKQYKQVNKIRTRRDKCFFSWLLTNSTFSQCHNPTTPGHGPDISKVQHKEQRRRYSLLREGIHPCTPTSTEVLRVGARLWNLDCKIHHPQGIYPLLLPDVSRLSCPFPAPTFP